MPIELDIVTPEGRAYTGHVDWVVLPGSEGDFGVLEGHERFLAPLRLGVVELSQGGRSVTAALSGGFADVSGSEVVVLAQACQCAEDIDPSLAERELAGAREALAALGEADQDRAHRPALEAALARAELWVEVRARSAPGSAHG